MNDDDPTQDYRQRTFVGVSRRDEGKDATFKEAMQNAYDRGKTDRGGTLRFRVLEIQITGDNPISEYKVVIGDI